MPSAPGAMWMPPQSTAPAAPVRHAAVGLAAVAAALRVAHQHLVVQNAPRRPTATRRRRAPRLPARPIRRSRRCGAAGRPERGLRERVAPPRRHARRHQTTLAAGRRALAPQMREFGVGAHDALHDPMRETRGLLDHHQRRAGWPPPATRAGTKRQGVRFAPVPVGLAFAGACTTTPAPSSRPFTAAKGCSAKSKTSPPCRLASAAACGSAKSSARTPSGTCTRASASPTSDARAAAYHGARLVCRHASLRGTGRPWRSTTARQRRRSNHGA